MSTVIELDLGPEHYAHAVRIGGQMVCILTPQAADDEHVQALVRRFMQSQGVDCKSCGGCPVGRAE
ncbi:hypothetical protein ACFY7H_13320 [Streptomyces sp. NPDC012794]|uniref:hypothetical protein n=1 Tax=Streptomyces sp. NPDC012794 TaxID=3364850 RepID=UPI003682B269